MFTRWRHRILRHCNRSTARGHASPIPLYHLPRLCAIEHRLIKSKKNGFELTKKRSRKYPAKKLLTPDYANDIAILANTPVQAETLLHSFGMSCHRHWSSMSMHTKRNTCALIKQATFSH